MNHPLFLCIIFGFISGNLIKTKENLLKQIFTNYDQLPVMLSPDQVASALGISRANAYTLFHADDFPSMRVGKRMMISKVHFLKWIERQSGGAA